MFFNSVFSKTLLINNEHVCDSYRYSIYFLLIQTVINYFNSIAQKVF